MRFAIACVALSCLAACGPPPVSTPGPVFAETDGQGAPTLRPGVWASASPDCDYDPNKPATAWPDCVQATLVRGSEMAEHAQSFDAYVLASGYPRILQRKVMVQPTDGEPHAEYLYDAVVAAGFDKQGHVVRARRWAVRCPRTDDDAPPIYPCLPAQADALRGAARDDSEASAWIWLRDGES